MSTDGQAGRGEGKGDEEEEGNEVRKGEKKVVLLPSAPRV